MDNRLLNQSKFIMYLSEKFGFDTDTEIEIFEKEQRIKVELIIPSQLVDINMLILLVEREFNIPAGSLKSNSRKSSIVPLRFVLYHLLHNIDTIIFSKTWLGNVFNRNHSSVIFGINKVNDMTDINDIQYLRIKQTISKIIENHAVKKEEVMQDVRNTTVHLGERKLLGMFQSSYKQKETEQIQTTQRWNEREFAQL